VQIPAPTQPDAQAAPQFAEGASPAASPQRQEPQETVSSNQSPQTPAEAPGLPAAPQLPPDPGAEIFAKFKSPIPAGAQDVIDRTFARLLSSGAKLVGKQISFAGQVIGVYSISEHNRVNMQAVNVLVNTLMKTENARDIESQIKLYAPTIVADGKTTARSQFKKDLLTYWQRWPEASWQLIDEPVFIRQVGQDSFEVMYRASFDVANAQSGKFASGNMKGYLTVRDVGKYVIAAFRDETTILRKGTR
jgi:hypothetical protein